MERNEILEKLLNYQCLWQIVVNRAENLLGDSEIATLSAELCSEAVIMLPDEAMESIRAYESAAEQERVFREIRQTAENQLKSMLGAAEIGRIGNRLVIWKQVRIEQFNEGELMKNEPEMHQDYMDVVTYRQFTIQSC